MKNSKMRAYALIPLLSGLGTAACGDERAAGSASGPEPLSVSTSALSAAECPAGYHVILGTTGDDVLEGTNGRDCIIGLAGDDVIHGGNGDDLISAGPGSDTVSGGNGRDRIFGDEGDDRLSGDNGEDFIDGGQGDDLIAGDNGPDELLGGKGNDIIDGRNGADVIDAGPGNDVVMPDHGRDSGSGGPGLDACDLADCETAPARSCSTASDCPDPRHQSCTGGACIYCRSDVGCSDGSVCTGVETCQPTTGCVGGEPLPQGHVAAVNGCSDGMGDCWRPGDMVCDGAGGMFCDAVPGAPRPDTDCDGRDDDCDGLADEDYVQAFTTCGVGSCSVAGLLSCVRGVEVDDCVPGSPTARDVCDWKDNDCDGTVDQGLPDRDGDGYCDDTDKCPFHSPPVIEGDVIVGTVECAAPYLTGTLDPEGLASLPVHIPPFGDTTTDCRGRFTLPVPEGLTLSAGQHDVAFHFDGQVPGPGGIATRLRITDDSDNSWGTLLTHFNYFRRVQGTLSTTPEGHRVLALDPVHIESSECELWYLATEIVNDFQTLKHEPTPGGVMKIIRHPVVELHGPLTTHDAISLPANILDGKPERWRLRDTLFHEAGHLIRDVYDGNAEHWVGDLFNYAYAQCHTGFDIYNEGYAFHEGFASYWAQARARPHARWVAEGDTAVSAYCDGSIGPSGLALDGGFTDWVEKLISDRLLDLSRCLGDGDLERGDVLLLETLEANPEVIHSLHHFERALCASTACGCDRPAPAPCPTGYDNLGEFCQGYGQSFRRFP